MGSNSDNSTTTTTTTNSSHNKCDLAHLDQMSNGSMCRIPWHEVRDVLHPSQQAVGCGAVQRKCEKDYKTRPKAQKRMDDTSGRLPFVLGPNRVPYLIDSHHTVSALETSKFHTVQVTLQKVCDWSHLTPAAFGKEMQTANFMNGTGRPQKEGGDEDPNALPVPFLDVTTAPDAIPRYIYELRDDPWRSLAALVRKTSHKDQCPAGHDKCLRGYIRDCRADGRMTPFFEFRWAYFFNDAYRHGCDNDNNKTTSFWDDAQDCHKFHRAYDTLMTKARQGQAIQVKEWQKAADLLVPLCRGETAQTYTLPPSLGAPMGGEPLPGVVRGKDTPILRDDPSCEAPACPSLATDFFGQKSWASLWSSSSSCTAADSSRIS
mmetsp:Transcript_8090/g.15417  ORF Transcript_8090/g.15417 Transcript_8090/m.15417 type:complete len:375 (+) Transcript_8090:38-1162(+)